MDHILALPKGMELVGDYALKRVLGAGGFGITYLARDLALDRNVAIKEYFPSEFAARDGSAVVRFRSQSCEADYKSGLERFVEEAQALARFEHPNIVRVFRYFRANNSAYMVLQFEAGRSLKGWLDDLGRRPQQSELDAILMPLLDALELLHANDFLHRDIAPDNILIRPDGSPVLIDFGSARGEMAARSRTVSAIVKPGYSPFEQYSSRGRRQGPWTDIYSLGATLYHVITGERPHDAPTRMSGTEISPARSVRHGDYREGFLAAIDQALIVGAENRPQSIAAWRRSLFGPSPAPRVFGNVAPTSASQSDLSVVTVSADPLPSYPLARDAAAEGTENTPLTSMRPNRFDAVPTRRDDAHIAHETMSALRADLHSDDDHAQPSTPKSEHTRATRKIATKAVQPLVWQRRPEPQQAPAPQIPATASMNQAAAVQEPAARSESEHGNLAWIAGAPEAARGLAGRLVHAVAERVGGGPSLFDAPTGPRARSGAPSTPPAGENEFFFPKPSAQHDIHPRAQTAAEPADATARAEFDRRVADVEADLEKARLLAARDAEKRAAAAAKAEARRAKQDAKAQQRAERSQLRSERVRLSRERRDAWRAKAGDTARSITRTSVRIALVAGLAFVILKVPSLLPNPAESEPIAAGLSLRAPITEIGLIRTLRGHGSKIVAVASAPLERRMASVDTERNIFLWDLDIGGEPRKLELSGSAITAIALEDNQLVVGRDSGEVELRDAISGSVLRTLARQDGAINNALFVDGRRARVITASRDGTLRVHDIKRGRYRTLRDHDDAVTTLAYAPGSERLITGSRDNTVKIWDIRRNRLLRTYHTHADDVTAVAIAVDGGLAASGSRDRSVKLWRPEGPANLKSLDGHEGPITALAFTPDGRFLISASEDNTVKLWDTGTGRLARTFVGHTASVRSIALLGDGTLMATAGDDETIRIWGLPQAGEAPPS